MAQVPQELIVEILLQLPVKPLLRFRSLSKRSCAVIDSPDFVKSHFSKSSQNLNFCKLILSYQFEEKYHVCDVNVDLEDEILPDSSLVGEVCGNCNGLLLLYRRGIGFSVYNPSTRQRRDLLDFPFDHKIGWGLGYDESVDDYKAVVGVYNYEVYEPQVWVCGLKSNIWRRVEGYELPVLGYFGFGYFANGHLYWVCKPSIEVVAFDMSTEKFSFVPQPLLHVQSLPELHVLEGHLCISYLDSCMPHRADIYMMMKEDEGDTFTWTQLHSVKEPFKNVDALEHSKGADKILLNLGYGKVCIVSYDLKKRSFVKVEMNKDPRWTAPILCLQSLVPVADGA